MIGVFQPWHLIVVLVIVMMVFGPGKLPELGQAVGDGLRELKKASGHNAASAVTSSSPVVVPTPVCPACQAAVGAHARFCGTCGAAVPGAQAAA